MAIRAEQETTATWYRDDRTVKVWTTNPVHLRRLEKLSEKFSFVRKVDGRDDYGDFEVDVENFNLFSAIRAKRAVTAAQRETAAERMRNLRRPSAVDEQLIARDEEV